MKKKLQQNGIFNLAKCDLPTLESLRNSNNNKSKYINIKNKKNIENDFLIRNFLPLKKITQENNKN